MPHTHLRLATIKITQLNSIAIETGSGVVMRPISGLVRSSEAARCSEC